MSLQQLQEQLGRSFDQMQALSIKLAAENTKVEFVNTDRVNKGPDHRNLNLDQGYQWQFSKPATSNDTE